MHQRTEQLSSTRDLARDSGVSLKSPTYMADPKAIATDYDGVFELSTNRDHVNKLRDLVIAKSIGRGAPLTIITGKEFGDAIREIAEPFRKAIAALGIQLQPGQFHIYTNNGGRTLGITANGIEVLDEKPFSPGDLEKIANIEGIQTLMEFYDVLNEIHAGIAEEMRDSHFRQKDKYTICLRINPEDLADPRLSPELKARINQLTGGKESPTRFDIAEGLRKECAEHGLEIVVSSTDRSIDLTPKGTGKRGALVDSSERTGVPIKETLRMGDTPGGMDFGLLAYAPGEEQPGFSCTAIDYDQIERIVASGEYSGFGIPVEIDAPGVDPSDPSAQFIKVGWLLDQVGRAESQQDVDRVILAA